MDVFHSCNDLPKKTIMIQFFLFVFNVLQKYKSFRSVLRFNYKAIESADTVHNYTMHIQAYMHNLLAALSCHTFPTQCI